MLRCVLTGMRASEVLPDTPAVIDDDNADIDMVHFLRKRVNRQSGSEAALPHGYNAPTMQPLPPLIRWNRSAAVLLSGFFLTIGLIVYVWWPLAEEVLRYIDWRGPWWLYMDWLLIGLFFFMSLTIIARADLRHDALILVVATIGGLVIEAWGTQTNLWFYYTSERPPLWIIPAWPIATLSIDRITRALGFLTTKVMKEHQGNDKQYTALMRGWLVAYWIVFGAFLIIRVAFVMPTFEDRKSTRLNS